MRDIWRHLRIYRTCLRNTIIRELTYRTNFFIWGLAMFMEFAINIIFFEAIFAGVPNIAGWSKYEWYFYQGFVQVLLTLFMVFLFPNLIALPWSINGGELDFLLLKPVSSQFMVSIRRANFGYITNLFAGAALMFYGWSYLHLSLEFYQFLAAVLYTLVGTMILYSIFLIADTIAIWTQRADFASTLYFSLWSFLRQPANVFGSAARLFFTYGLPILLVCTTPVHVVLGRATSMELAATLAVGMTWLIASTFFWRQAIRHYTSASS